MEHHNKRKVAIRGGSDKRLIYAYYFFIGGSRVRQGVCVCLCVCLCG